MHSVEAAVAAATEGADRYLVRSMLEQQPDLAALERDHAGIVAAMYQAGRPLIIEIERRNAVKVQKTLAAIYQNELTVADMEAARRFFSSDTGKKILRGMFDPAAVKNMVEIAARNPEAKLEAQTLSRVQMQTALTMAAGLSEEDERNSAAFLATSSGTKMHALTPRVQAKVLEIVNSPDPDLQAQLESTMEAAALRFIERPKK